MTALRDAIEKYISLRQSLGFKLEAAASGLRQFATFMELKGAAYITTDLAYEWATQPAHVQSVRWAQRLGWVHIFARHWRATDSRTEIPPAGLITLHGKGQRVDQLPLPIEVGQAIADAKRVRLARPACGPCRRVFIRNHAPWVGLANSVAICSLVNRALRRAGVESVRRGSHLFRHSLATRMINSGSALPEIGEVLRHRHPDTTRIYAKVDLASLRTIALPWPGGCR